MKKNWGVSFMEIILAVAVSLFFGAITIPKMVLWYQKDTFMNEIQGTFDSINNARTSSIAKKQCSNNKPSISWGWQYSKINNKFQIICFDEDNNKNIDEETELSKNLVETVLYTKINNTFNEESEIELNFNPQNKKSLINNNYKIKKFKINFTFKKKNSFQKTICFDPKSGFPTLSKTNECLE